VKNAHRVLDWSPLRRNGLLGFVNIELPSGKAIAGVTMPMPTSKRGPLAHRGRSG
jgi:hypothetical protein